MQLYILMVEDISNGTVYIEDKTGKPKIIGKYESNPYSEETKTFAHEIIKTIEDAAHLSGVTCDLSSTKKVLLDSCKDAEQALKISDKGARDKFITNIIGNIANVVTQSTQFHQPTQCSACDNPKINCKPVAFESKTKSSLEQICMDCFTKLCIRYLNGAITCGGMKKVILQKGDLKCEDFDIFVKSFYFVEYGMAEEQLKLKHKSLFNKEFKLGKHKFIDHVGAINIKVLP